MFLAKVPRVDYQDPWTAGFDERLGALLSGSPRIAYYYAQPDTSTFRYRVYNMIEALSAAEPGASAAWFTSGDGPNALRAVGYADVLVVCRALYTPHVAAVIERARSSTQRVLFDVDDFVFDPRYVHLIMETLDQTVDEAGLTHWFAYLARQEATLRLCDGVITTSDYLADRIRAVHDVPAAIVPNFLNSAQLAVSARVLEAKAVSGFARDRQIHLGYFSGTPTHNRDFAIAQPALLRLMEEDSRVALRVVGFLPSFDRLAGYQDRIEVLPLDDFINLQRLIGEVEINIVPLQDNEFTNCKSELKYFEAAAVGTVSVASPTYTLRRAIRHGENGVLAFAQDWYAALRQALEGIEDVQVMAEAAAADALERYSPEAQSASLRQALLGEPDKSGTDPRGALAPPRVPEERRPVSATAVLAPQNERSGPGRA